MNGALATNPVPRKKRNTVDAKQQKIHIVQVHWAVQRGRDENFKKKSAAVQFSEKENRAQRRKRKQWAK